MLLKVLRIDEYRNNLNVLTGLLLLNMYKIQENT